MARDLSVSARLVRKILRCAKPVSAEVALRLARYFGSSDQFWMNLQMRYDLEIERERLGKRLAKEVAVLEPAM